jgi:Ca2+-transporting ATPase
LAGLPLLFLPVHLVWLELVVHPVSALVFEAEPAPPDAMRKPPRHPDQPLLPDFNIIISLVSGLLLSVVVAGLFIARLPQGVTYARSCAMAALILGSLFLSFAERALDKAWWKVPFPRTARFWIVMLAVGLSLPAIIEIPGLDDIFLVSPITPRDWTFAAGLSFAAIAWRSFGFKLQQKSLLSPRSPS